VEVIRDNNSEGFVAIEAIALMIAGIGKTTIYRWWSSKTAVVIDVFMKKVTPEIPFSETPSASVALKAQVASIVKAFSGDYGRIVAEIIAEGQADSEAQSENSLCASSCHVAPRSTNHNSTRHRDRRI
jgi:hypothetical protein